jgi:sterol desaturase/sphingolipid hydroxylase (fatty acid hydroxylase superfamily)
MPQSAISYFADSLLSPVLAIGLAAVALSRLSGFGILAWSLSVLAGAALWTLAEYVIHRAVYHRVSFIQQYHAAHHANPRAYLGAPPGMGTGLVFVSVFLPTYAIAPILANGLTVGILAGYAAYQLVHHACHSSMPRRRGYLHQLRVHHAAHHYYPEAGNFGVTTPLWDRVFGTQIRRRATPTVTNASALKRALGSPIDGKVRPESAVSAPSHEASLLPGAKMRSVPTRKNRAAP